MLSRCILGYFLPISGNFDFAVAKPFSQMRENIGNIRENRVFAEWEKGAVFRGGVEGKCDGGDEGRKARREWVVREGSAVREAARGAVLWQGGARWGGGGR